MTEAEIKAAVLAKAVAEKEAKAALENETEEERLDREAQEAAKVNEPDYEAELAKERERAEKAEKAAAELAFQNRRERRKDKDGNVIEGGELDEDKPLTARQLQTMLDADRQKNRKELQSEMIVEKARKIASSDSEARYIAEIHKNRTFPAGMSLDEQLEEAYAIANRKKVVAQNSELKRALISKETAGKGGGSAHQDDRPAGEPRLAPNDLSAIKAAGLAWDGKAKLYTKKIAGGKKTLYYDPKTQKRWTE